MVAALQGTAVGVAPVPVAELPTERLEAELCQQAAHLDAAMCRWLLVLGEFDERAGYWAWGCRSAAHFLNWRCGISMRTARDHVRVAKALRRLPLVVEAFGQGELSYSKVRAITRIGTEATEETLIMWARHATAAILERIVAGYKKVERLEAGVAERAEHISWCHDDDTSLEARMRLSPEDGALFLAALARSRQDLEKRCSAEHPHDSGSADEADKPRRPTNVDAFRAMCETVLANGPKPAIGPDRTRVVLHVQADTGEGHLHDGPSLHPDTVRLLCCDSGGREVLWANGVPFDLGRRTREPSQKQRLFLMVRDGGCVFPGCPERRFVDAHHIVHWIDGGPTDVTNLVLACNHHHRAVHRGGYRVELTTTGARWWRPDGRPIDPSCHPPVLEGPDVIEQNEARGLQITPDTPVALWDGSHPMYSWCVEGLLAEEDRHRKATAEAEVADRG
jgi:hypothetical protein